MKRIFLILKEDIVEYPPMLTLLTVLPRLGYSVTHIGAYSDEEGKKRLESIGVRFVPTVRYKGNANIFYKLFLQYRFKADVLRALRSENISQNDILWITQIETLCLLHKLVGKYKTIIHLLEFVGPSVPWKYRLLSPSIRLSDVLSKAGRVICCEYNRAQITKGVYQLDELPAVLPNKMEIRNDGYDDIPLDIKKVIEETKTFCQGKKVILYQGIFLDKERRLEEFCDAILKLPDDYVLIAMGKGSEMYENLKKKYKSAKILFLPFIKPPYHLLVTQMATIGILSYFPRSGSVGRTINPLYCAPNKIFEYSKYGVPMISNDIPALKYTFLEYHCGECIHYPITPEAIETVVKKVVNNYSYYNTGAIEYYKSVDVEKIIKDEILSNI